jgi:S-adenosylmethionine:tRNA ribosyltransferase-isomerase
VPMLNDRWWVVEVRSADGSTPAHRSPDVGEVIRLGRDRGERLELVAPYGGSDRLWTAELHADGETVPELLWRLGEPIRYGYVDRRWPLDAYQNVYATTPGSAEMPSAGRPFSAELIAALPSQGIKLATLCLHTGLSSPERHEPPFPERYDVPDDTARLVAGTRAAGGRVIAVGTTVVRALETVVGDDGTVRAGAGWTDLVIEPDRELGAVDGLITGWHEPEASHLMMLEAIGGAELLERSYAEAIRRGYLWHEFGDSHLILR